MDHINKTLLPGKLKLGCFQFGILPRILWPLTVYEIERVISTQLKQWLGVPRCLSSIGLYGNGKLELPIVDVVEESRCTKARLVMTLSESEDTVIRTAAPRVATGRKWTLSEAVHRAKPALQRCSWSNPAWESGPRAHSKSPLWHKATGVQKR